MHILDLTVAWQPPCWYTTGVCVYTLQAKFTRNSPLIENLVAWIPWNSSMLDKSNCIFAYLLCQVDYRDYRDSKTKKCRPSIATNTNGHRELLLYVVHQDGGRECGRTQKFTVVYNIAWHTCSADSKAVIWLVTPHSWIWTTRYMQCYQTLNIELGSGAWN